MGKSLACPYFMPREIVDDGSWPHPSRLPLGAGWNGSCRAAAQESVPSEKALREFCNLGYAVECPHLPPQHDWDAVRFSVLLSGRDRVTIRFTCELNHAPSADGILVYDRVNEGWILDRSARPSSISSTDPRVLALADCYVQARSTRHATRPCFDPSDSIVERGHQLAEAADRSRIKNCESQIEDD